MEILSMGAQRRASTFIGLICAAFGMFALAGCATMSSAPTATTSGAISTNLAPVRQTASVPPATEQNAPQPDEPAAASQSTAADDDQPATEEAEEVEPSPLDELPDTTTLVPQSTLDKDKSIVAESFAGFDIPMVLNESVAGFVDYFMNPHHELFDASLVRSGRYVATFQTIFQQAGIPLDLVYMAHVESAFKTNAYSRSKAKGIFQFISETGRRYGLRIDSWVDERSDPEKSARAAAAYLKDLHDMFGDWYLALAAYNAGEGKVQRALAQTKKNDFWSLASTRSLRAETKNYVPAILAATLIAKQPGKFGFDPEFEKPIATDVVRIEGQTDLRVLARLGGMDADVMKQLNPQLRRGMTPPGDVTEVKVPAGMGDAMSRAYTSLPASERLVLARHEVESGESLASIAHQFGVTSTQLATANKLAKNATVKPGQQLIIPAVSASTKDEKYDRSSAVAYRVRKGDTLYEIASHYKTTPAAIASASGISVHSDLLVGQRLTIPAKGGAVRVAKAESTHAAPATSSIVHTVRRGETLYRIADHYQVTVDQICALNRITPNGVLYPGTKLTIRSN